MKQLLILLSIVFCLFSCSSDCEYAVDLKDVNADVSIKRLEKELFEIQIPRDAEKFIQNNPLVVERYFGFPLGQAEALAQNLYHIYTNKEFNEFYKQGEKINNNFQELNSSVADLFKHIKYYFPSYRIPALYTTVTGLPEPTQGRMDDIVFGDSLVVIGIDYFYGSKSKWRPRGEYNYMLQRREPYYIVPTLALRLAQEEFVHIKEDEKTMLDEMIKWGKAHYFMERVMPCVPDSIIIGYTSPQIQEVENNMDIIWSYFIENKLFYETNSLEIHRFTGEAPKVAVIGEKCPGRIGRYIGWQIVKTYMDKNPEVTLKELMKETDAAKIFKLSKYKPKAK